MHIMALSGSLRRHSYNTALLRHAARHASNQQHIDLFSGLEAIPAFNADHVDTPTPNTVDAFRTALQQADGLLISTPEYAHGIPGALKNALDWVVASGELVLKPVAVMSVSTTELGGARAHHALVMVLHAMNARVVVECSLNIAHAKRKFDPSGMLLDVDAQHALQASMAAFSRMISAEK